MDALAGYSSSDSDDDPAYLIPPVSKKPAVASSSSSAAPTPVTSVDPATRPAARIPSAASALFAAKDRYIHPFFSSLPNLSFALPPAHYFGALSIM
jgi:hypothetical protein